MRSTVFFETLTILQDRARTVKTNFGFFVKKCEMSRKRLAIRADAAISDMEFFAFSLPAKFSRDGCVVWQPLDLTHGAKRCITCI